MGADPLDPGWRAASGDGLQLTIDLTPLALAESETIARGFPAVEAFAAKCVERAGGNPLFLEQLLRTAGDFVDGKLPSTIQSVVLARTDLLAPSDKRAIEAASVLGQRFALMSLRALIDDPRYTCETLLRNALLRPVADGLQFVHALVRDGVYASLTRTRRRQLHRSAAEVYLNDPVLRAEHLDLAEDPQAPQAYLGASRDQETFFRLVRASGLAIRGLAIATEPSDRVALALQVGGLQLDAGRGEDALEAYRTALVSGAVNADRVRALIGCAAANRLLARIDDAFAALSDAEPMAGANASSRELAEIHYLRGNLHFARGELEVCRSEHESALDVAVQLDSPEWRARALSGLADAQYMDCRMATALNHFMECVGLCDVAGLARIAVPNRVMMGHCRIYLCDFDAALDDMRRALETARRIGNSHAEMFALQSTGLCLTAAGRHDETVEIQAEALKQARRLKARRYEAIILAVCAERALVAGQRAEALSLVRSGLEASEETSPGFVGPILFGLLAIVDPSPAGQEAAISAGESLLAKGAVGHNHFWFGLTRLSALCAPEIGTWPTDTLQRSWSAQRPSRFPIRALSSGENNSSPASAAALPARAMQRSSPSYASTRRRPGSEWTRWGRRCASDTRNAMGLRLEDQGRARGNDRGRAQEAAAVDVKRTYLDRGYTWQATVSPLGLALKF
jgi:tetratricopeptide (TPR) repeat protein